MSEHSNTAATRTKSTTGINFDARILAYLDELRRDSPVFQRRSRSEIVNMIIEDYAAQNGRRIDQPQETRQSA